MDMTKEQREMLETVLIRKMITAAKQALKGKVNEKDRDRIAMFCAANGAIEGLEMAEDCHLI